MSTTAAGGVNIVLSLNSASYSKAIKEAQNQLDAFAGKTKAAGHGTVTSMQAASASIRLLENPLGNNRRAIERLLSQSKHLGGVMNAAFPVVGAVALGSVIFDQGSEIEDFVKKANAVPNAITTAFRSMHAAICAYFPASDVKRARKFYEEIIGLVPKTELAGGVVYECGGSTVFLSNTQCRHREGESGVLAGEGC